MRPTTYCARCGEYMEDRGFEIITVGSVTVRRRALVHIDADGKQIFRNHVPVEE